MEKSGAVAKTFGVSMNEMIGHITAIGEVTKESGSVIGNSLKTIYQNILGKKEAQDALEAIGIQVKDNAGQMRKAGDVIDELGKKWNSLTDAQRQNVAMSVAGTYQLTRFTALMNNYDTALKAAETANNSAGSATRENEKYQRSLQAQIARLTVAWEQLAITAGSSGLTDAFKSIVYLITQLTKAFTWLIDTFGFFPTTFTMAGMAAVLFSKQLRNLITQSQVAAKVFQFLNISIESTRATLLSMGVAGVAMFAIGYIIEKMTQDFSDYVDIQSEVQASMDETTDKFMNQGSQIKSLSEEYARLSQQGGDLARLNDVQNQLAQLLPDVVAKVDANGQAHLMSAKAVQEHVKQMEDLVKEQAKFKSSEALDNLEKTFSKIAAQNKKVKDIQKELERGYTAPGVVGAKAGPIPLSPEQRIYKEKELQKALETTNDLQLQATGYLQDYVRYQLYAAGALDKLTQEDKQYIDTEIQQSMQYVKSKDEAIRVGKEFLKQAEEISRKRTALQGASLSTEEVKGISYSDAQEIGLYFKQFKDGKINLAEFEKEMQKVGLTSDQVDEILKGLNATLDDQNKKIIDTAAARDRLKSIFDNYTKSVQDLEGALNTLNQGQELSLQQIFELITAYPELAGQLEVQNGYLTFQGDAIQAIINAQKAKLKAEIEVTKGELEALRTSLRQKMDAVESELQMYDVLKKVGQERIDQIYKEAEAIAYKRQMEKVQFTGDPYDDLRKQQLIERNASIQYEKMKGQISQYADWKKQYEEIGKTIKGLDTLADNIDKVSNSITSTGGMGQAMQTQIYIVDKYANALGDLTTRLKEVESLQKRYPEWSGTYREAIQKEIDLIEKKLGLLKEERDDLANQIKTGNIKPTGLVTISGGGGYGSSSIADYYLNSGTFRLTSKFGEVSSLRGGRPHGGIDLAAPTGTPIKSLIDGYVARSGYQAGGAGYYVVIADGSGRETKYFHMKGPTPLSQGTRVAAGQIVGYVGQTGHATGSHVHIEVTVNGKRIDPLTYMRQMTGADVSAFSGGGGGYSGKYASIINEAASRYGVSPALIAGIIQAESSFNPNARSGVGAMGLMQLMPGTARSLGVKNPYDPYQNIMGGTKYIAQLINRYNGDVQKALAAYNWGPGYVDKRGYAGAPSSVKSYVSHVLSNASKFGGVGSATGAGAYPDESSSYAEWLQSIDQAKEKKRQLDQEYIDTVDQLYQLRDEIVKSHIEEFKHQRELLQLDRTHYEVGAQINENENPELYRYYLEQKKGSLNQEINIYQNELKYIEEQLKNNKQITDAMRQELNMTARDAKENIYQLQEQIVELNKSIAESKLNELTENFAVQFGKISDKVDDINKQLHMVDEGDEKASLDLLKQRLEVYLEQRDAINEQIKKLQDLKNEFKDNKELASKIDEELHNWNSQLDEIDTNVFDTKKEMKDIATSVANQVIDAMKQVYEKQKELELQGLEDQINAFEDAHNKKMDMLDEEMQKYEDNINKQLDLLDKTENEQNFNRELSKRNEEIQKIQDQIAKYSLDDSLEGRAKVKDLQDQLKDLIEQRDEFMHQHEVELRRDALQKQLDDKRKQIDEEQKLENDSYQKQRDEFEKMRQDIEKKWENILNDERRFSDIQKQIISGNVEGIKAELVGMLDYLNQHSKEIGESISNNLIDAIKEAMDSMKGLYDFIQNPTETVKPPEGMPSNYEDIYKKRHTQFETVKFGDEGDNIKELQKRLRINQTGKFDQQTQQAVISWQIAHGLNPTGEVDDFLWRALGFQDDSGRPPILMKGNQLSWMEPWIVKLQKRLNVKQTGNFDEATRQAVINWQKAHGFTPDGIVSDDLWAALGFRWAGDYLPILTYKGSNPSDWVKKLQEKLGIQQTGYFDDKTLEAVKDFQSKNNLPINGIVDDAMWEKLGITDLYKEWDQWLEDNKASQGRQKSVWDMISDLFGISSTPTPSVWNDIMDFTSQNLIASASNGTTASTLGTLLWNGLSSTGNLTDVLKFPSVNVSTSSNYQTKTEDTKPYILQLQQIIDAKNGNIDAKTLFDEFVKILKQEGIIL